MFIISGRRIAEFLYTRLNMARVIATSDEILSQTREQLREIFYSDLISIKTSRSNFVIYVCILFENLGTSDVGPWSYDES